MSVKPVKPVKLVKPVQPIPPPTPTAASSVRAQLRESVTIAAAALALRRFVRSRWLPIDLALLLALFLVCFRFPFGATYFFDITTFGIGGITVVTAYALVRILVPPITYLRMGLRSSLRGVLTGLTLATAVISTFLILLLLFLALITQRFAGTTAGLLVAGAIGLIANCILLGTLTIVLSTPATNTLLRLAFLVWLVLAFASYNADGFLAVLLFPARLLLLPFAVCYNFGVTGVIGWGGLLALLAEAAYVFGLVWFADVMLRRRLRRHPRIAQEL